MLPKRALPYSWDQRGLGREGNPGPGGDAGDAGPGESGWDVGNAGLEDSDWEFEDDFEGEGEGEGELALDVDADADAGGDTDLARGDVRADLAGVDFRAERSVRAVAPLAGLAPVLRSPRGRVIAPDDSDMRPSRSARPDAWEPPRPLRQRVLRAASVPQLVGAVVFLVAIAIALVLVWSQPHAPEVDVAGGAEAAGLETAGESTAETGQPGEGTSSALPGGGEDEPATESSVFVHVVGAVHKPGVVELPAASRVGDAVAKAGGATDAAVLSGVNLARVVVDGEQIIVPDAAGLAAGGSSGGAGGSLLPDATQGSAGSGMSAEGPVDLNTADLALLETLPRVGPALARRILDWRAANGRFVSVEQLLEVPGIGAKTLDGFRDRVKFS